ncbi:MAG: hypothetical protein FJ225_10570 [Lentisphaerae bacterium]|nr:hypothetical protein [Lentisphaerota bacterium]
MIKWDEAAKQLRVTGVFRKGDKHLAVVKGVGVVETGDVVAVQYGDLTYRWVVKSIDARGIVPARLDVFPTNQPR